MNDYLFALIIAAYIIGGVFIVLWRDRNYFDAKYGSESSEKWSVWRVLFWPFILPFVWPKALRIKKQRIAQAHADFEAMMAHWDAVAEEAKEMVSEGNVLVHGTAGEAIPDMVTEIGEQAFCCCEELQEVVIPGSVKKNWQGSLLRLRRPDQSRHHQLGNRDRQRGIRRMRQPHRDSSTGLVAQTWHGLRRRPLRGEGNL